MTIKEKISETASEALRLVAEDAGRPLTKMEAEQIVSAVARYYLGCSVAKARLN
jgi:hypothetical protein